VLDIANMGSVRVAGYEVPSWLVIVALVYLAIQVIGAFAALIVTWRRSRRAAKNKEQQE